jgi:hypothetical protein
VFCCFFSLSDNEIKDSEFKYNQLNKQLLDKQTIMIHDNNNQIISLENNVQSLEYQVLYGDRKQNKMENEQNNENNENNGNHTNDETNKENNYHKHNKNNNIHDSNHSDYSDNDIKTSTLYCSLLTNYETLQKSFEQLHTLNHQQLEPISSDHSKHENDQQNQGKQKNVYFKLLKIKIKI